MVSSAGITPTKNTARQPYRGSTSQVTIAAAPYPIAQALCISPSALPRCSRGQLSDTSDAPLAHSPPIPIPRQMRKTASCTTLCDRPHAAVKTE